MKHSEPVLYKKGQYGIRIENVLEVTDPGRRHTSGTKFLKFGDISLVPYEPKLIEKGLLSVQEVRVSAKQRQNAGRSFHFIYYPVANRNAGSTNTMHAFEHWWVKS